MKIGSIGEDRLIERIASRLGASGGRRRGRVVVGIGDDTSVSRQAPGRLLLATTDALVEGVHFKKDWTDPVLLGRKAVNISFSDIAAMGGSPLFVLVSLTLPGSTTSEFVDALYKGACAAASRFDASVAGGNTARSRCLTVTTTVVGEAPAGKAALRSGARAGDAVFVTGALGDSGLGLWALKRRGRAATEKGPLRRAVSRHLDPVPRIDAGRILAASGLVNAMMDISDGLMLDLKRLCRASGVGAVVETARLPLSAELLNWEKGRAAAVNLALTGGEDYELLFTAPPGGSARVKAAGEKAGVPVTEIGRVLPAGEGVRAVGPDGEKILLKRPGYEHF